MNVNVVLFAIIGAIIGAMLVMKRNEKVIELPKEPSAPKEIVTVYNPLYDYINPYMHYSYPYHTGGYHHRGGRRYH